VKRSTVVVILAILLAGLILFGLSDTAVSVADTSIPDNVATGAVSNASNSSATVPLRLQCIRWATNSPK
jgi:hypothetical protein